MKKICEQCEEKFSTKNNVRFCGISCKNKWIAINHNSNFIPENAKRTGKRLQKCLRELYKQGKHPSQTEEFRNKASERMRINNPMFNKETVVKVHKKVDKINREQYRNGRVSPFANPEILHRALVNSGKATGGKSLRGEVLLFGFVRRFLPEGVCENNYYVNLNNGKHNCFIDVAVPAIKIGFEYDGYWTHYTPEGQRKDKLRDEKLRKLGWNILRINRNDIYRNDIKQVIKTWYYELAKNKINKKNR